MDKNQMRAQMRARTAKFGKDIVTFCNRLAKRSECWKVSGQLLDAGTSVAANYHAALRGRSRAEFIAKLGTVNEEVDESVIWLTTIKETGLDKGPELEHLLQEAIELRAIVARSYSTAVENVRKNKAAKAKKEQTSRAFLFQVPKRID